MTPLAWLTIIVAVIVVAILALWYAETRDLSNYERDELPPPPENVIDLSGRTIRFGDRETRQ